MNRHNVFRTYLLTFIAIILIGTSYYFGYGAQAEHQALASNKAPSPAIQKSQSFSPLDAAKLMSEAFVEVSSKVTPSIVMIANEEKLKADFGDNDLSDFFGNDLFQRFFQFTPEQREQIQKTLGSGVIISSDGYIITNNHVVDHSAGMKVTLPDGNRVSAKIIGTDPKTDLALIKVDAQGLQPIHFADYKTLQVGEWVIAVGSPFGEALQRTVTAGILSAKGRSNVGIADYEDFLQTDAAINPGNSGGALVDLNGNLIGINTAIVSSNGSNAGVGFAIPINIVQDVTEQLRMHGHVVRSYIGVTIQDLTPEIAKSLHLNRSHGAVVSDVQKASPGERASLKQYDVIISVNGKTVGSNLEVRNAIAELKPGAKAELGILRNGKEMQISITPEEMKGEEQNSKTEDRAEDLGMELQNMTPNLANQLDSKHNRGVIIKEVTPGSIADEAGLQRGDIIFEMNRQQIGNLHDFRQILRSSKNEGVLLAVKRKGGTFFVTLDY
ncbi:MAG TPA: DegQ family serine endoprotease [Acidobacteriota bacterium]|nr:DegQ family serine endoprotease [Acidobacteriota bacterium]